MRLTLPGADRVALPLDGLHPTTRAAIDRTMRTLIESSGWWIGDWLASTDRDALADLPAADVWHTSRCHVVAERFPPDQRRPTLPWTYHAEVADLPPADAATFLDLCENDPTVTLPKLQHLVRSYRQANTT